MILTIIMIVITLVGILMLISPKIKHSYNDGIVTAGLLLCIIGGIFALASLGMIIMCNNSLMKNEKKIWYEETVETLKTNYNFINTITDDKAKSIAIITYNNDVKDFKVEIITNQSYLNNPWINWMNCYEYNNMDANAVNYIE